MSDEVQVPADNPESAQRLCAARLLLENEIEWHNAGASGRTLQRAQRIMLRERLHLSHSELKRVLRGFDLCTLSGYTNAQLRGVSPWYDSLFDPTCPRQVKQGSPVKRVPSSIAQEIDECLDHIAEAVAVRSCDHHVTFSGTVTGRVSSSQPSIQQLPKEKPMSKPIEITTKTLVNGSDISGYNDAELYEMIASEEKKIAELNKIENKPKRLVAEIEKRQAGIQALVNYLDSKAD